MVETDVKQGLSRPELWERIRVVELPGATSPKTWFGAPKHASFKDRLESKHDLTAESARRLEEEYRRFLYLKAVDGGLLTPSRRVDQAWHLHIETEGGAWDEFCKDVLRCSVEHKTGLPSAEAKASYERTLSLYDDEFGERPPKDIWPGAAEKWLVAIAVVMTVCGFLGFFATIVIFGIFSESDKMSSVVAYIGFSCFLLALLGINIGRKIDLPTSCG